MDLQIIDYIVLGVFAFALIVGFVKGLLSQLFTFAAIAGAGAIAVIGAPSVSGLLAGVITDPATCNLVTIIVLFLVALIVLSIILGAINKALRKIKILKVIDILLGGVLAVGIVYSIIAVIHAFSNMPYEEGSVWAMILPFFKNMLGKSAVLNVIYVKNPIGAWVLSLLA